MCKWRWAAELILPCHIHSVCSVPTMLASVWIAIRTARMSEVLQFRPLEDGRELIPYELLSFSNTNWYGSLKWFTFWRTALRQVALNSRPSREQLCFRETASLCRRRMGMSLVTCVIFVDKVQFTHVGHCRMSVVLVHFTFPISWVYFMHFGHSRLYMVEVCWNFPILEVCLVHVEHWTFLSLCLNDIQGLFFNSAGKSASNRKV
jgi:hypothetical protein